MFDQKFGHNMRASITSKHLKLTPHSIAYHPLDKEETSKRPTLVCHIDNPRVTKLPIVLVRGAEAGLT